MRKDCHNILYILASPTWGGGEEYVYRIMEAFAGRGGYDCRAVTMSRQNTAKMSAVADAGHLYDFRPGSLLDMVSALRIARIADKHRTGIIHAGKFSHAFIAVWARALSRSRPHVVMTRHLIKKAKTSPLYNWLYDKLDCMIFVSEMAYARFMESGPRVPRNAVVLRNGVADMPQDPSLRDEDGIPVIAFAGRIVPDKGVDVLIEALGELKRFNWKARIIGSGSEDYIAGLQNMAGKLGLAGRISFTGFTDDVNAALQDAHIGVAPSVTPEPFGLSIAEYMRSGLAVVTTDNGAQPEFLTDGADAILVPPRDPRALADALAGLLADPEKRKKMGKAARKTFSENLTLDIFMQKLIKIYDEVCG